MIGKRFRTFTATAMTVALITAGCDASPPSSTPRWTKLDVRTTFGRRMEANPIGYVSGRYVFGGGTVPRRQQLVVSDAPVSQGSPRLWSSRDLSDWSPISTMGLPRHLPCGTCGPEWIVTHGKQHVLAWSTGDSFRLYASADLKRWRHVFTNRNTVTFDLERTRRGFLVSSRVGPPDGPWTYVGYESGDGLSWKPVPAVPPPGAGGLPAGAKLRHNFYVIDKSVPGEGRLMESADQRVWAPVVGATLDLERGPIASRRRDLLVAEAFDHNHHDTSLGRIVTSADAVHWQEPANFRRRFPKLDVTDLDRVGDWWVGTGALGRTNQQNRRWVAFATRDPERGPWIERRLPRARYSWWYVVSEGGVAILVGADGNVIFRPPQ